ncbi:MAG: gliding motility-associated C-terminal domain-containing protein [Bacteroidota bacterium]
MKITKLLLVLFILICLEAQPLAAQCTGITLAGQDFSICEPGELIQLNGSYSGSGDVTYTWSPDAGMSNPNGQSTEVFVNSTTTFTLNTTIVDPSNNLIVNPGFESGLTGFTSDYVPGTGGIYGLLSDEGEFAVAGNSNETHTNFANCPAYSGNEMLVVNGSTIPGENIWCQTVSVVPNTEYQMSAWLATVVSDNPANLQFFVNGQQIGGIFSLSLATCNWEQFFGSWNSGGSSSAEICIVNQNTLGGGNDFAMDELVFAPVCTQSDEVTVSVVPMLVFILDPGELPCTAGSTIDLDGSFSISGFGYSFQWTTPDGNIVSGANSQVATVDQPGTYTLTITYMDQTVTCTEQSSVVVVTDPNVPNAQAIAPDLLSCENNQVQLDGSGSTSGSSITYQWTTSGGNIVSGSNSPNPIVDASGSYTLVVTNATNGCSDETTIFVDEDFSQPLSLPIVAEDLDCQTLFVELDGSNSTIAPNHTYQWSTTDGNISSGENLVNATADLPGTYQLIVTNLNSGCADTAEVVVTQNLDLPFAEASLIGSVDCNDPTASLSGGSSTTGPNISYQWSSTNGSITSGSTTLNPTIGSAGTFTLTVTNTTNGCTAEAQVTVVGDVDGPTIDITTPAELSCNTTEIDLDATNSQAGTGISYQWTTADGNIVSGANTAQPTIDESGTYQLVMTNADNGCTSQETVIVMADTLSPIAEAGSGVSIDCGSGPQSLSGLGSSTVGNYSYQWTTTNGSIDSGADSLSPLVSTGGLYQLEVINLDNGCTATDTVSVMQSGDLPTAQIDMPAQIDCTNDQVQLDATSSDQGPGFSFNWSTPDGNFFSGTDGLQPVVDEAGTYTLSIIDQDNSCETSAQVIVVVDTLAPSASAGLPDTLSCLVTSLVLDGAASSSGPQFDYTWSTADGQIQGPTDQITASIDAPGTYQIEVTDQSNGCIATDLVSIAIDTLSPMADAGQDQVLNCQDSSFVLGGTGSSSGSDFIFNWTSAGGSFDGPTDGSTVLVSTVGTYQLQIVDSGNGCETVDQIVVTEDREIPMVEAGPDFTLTCSDPVLSPSSTASSGAGISYEWSTINGNIAGPADQLITTVNQAGEYLLEVVDNDNFCRAFDSVTVDVDTLAPIVEAGPTDTLSCNQTTLVLDGSASSSGPQFTYAWSSTDGQIQGPADQATVSIDAAGTYQLQIVNTDNGCVATDLVTIGQDSLSPMADAGIDQVLNCQDSSFLLGGPGTSLGSEYAFEWTTTGGSFDGPTDAASAMISTSGTYQLVVTNTDNGCEAIDEVLIQIDQELPMVNAGPDLTITCTDQQFNPMAMASTGVNFNYSWSTPDGNLTGPADQLMTTLNEAGTYTILVVNTDNFCQSSDLMVVDVDTVAPIADAGLGNTLSCSQPSLILDGSASSSGLVFEYTWTSTDGQFQGPTDENTALVDAPGTYQLLIVNTSNGCESVDIVQVDQDTIEPMADAGLDRVLNCQDSSFVLGGPGSSTGINFTYSWTSAGGSIDGPADGLNALVSTSGTYQLVVFDQDNGCEAIDQVVVDVDRELPQVDAGPDFILTCVDQEFDPIATASVGAGFSYNWSTNDGSIAGPIDQLMTTFDQPGTYQLVVFNTNNFCQSSDQLTVGQDTVSPIASIAVPGPLDCATNIINISASASSTGAAFNYDWTTTTGNIIGGSDSNSPTVDEPGIYQLLVTDIDNGCTATSIIEVVEDRDPPTVEILPAEVLTCTNTEIELNGLGSSQGPDFNVNWSTTDGNFAAGADGLEPQVDAPGTYTLTILNVQNACSAAVSQIVLQDVEPPSVDAGTDVVQNCVSGPANLLATVGGTGPFTYSWTGAGGQVLSGADGPNPTVEGEGIFTLLVIDESNGCQSEDQLALSQNLLLDFELDQVEATCAVPTGLIQIGDVLGDSPPYIYSVDGGNSFQSTPAFGGLAAGSYQVVVQDVNGCELSEAIVLTPPDELGLFLLDQVEIELGDSLQLFPQLTISDSEIDTLIWSPAEGLSCTDCLTPFVSATETRLYRLEVRGIDGCDAAGNVTVLVDRQRPIYFPSAFSPNGDGTNERFYPFARNAAVVEVRSFLIANRWGETVFSAQGFQPNDPAFGWDGTHRGQTLNPAVFVYQAEIEFADGVVELFKGDVTLVR